MEHHGITAVFQIRIPDRKVIVMAKDMIFNFLARRKNIILQTPVNQFLCQASGSQKRDAQMVAAG